MALAHEAASGAAARKVKMIINGELVDAASGAELTVEAPGTRQVIAAVPRGVGEDVERAVAAAKAALPGWSRVMPRERGKLLLKIADALEAEIEPLAKIIAEETGNAIRTRPGPRRRRLQISSAISAGLAANSKARPFRWASTF